MGTQKCQLFLATEPSLGLSLFKYLVISRVRSENATQSQQPDYTARGLSSLSEPVPDPIRAPRYGLVLLARLQLRVVYRQSLERASVPSRMRVHGDHVEDAVVAGAMKREAQTNWHRQ